MPRIGKQEQAEKRERILRHATTLFSQHGFSETTVAVVAKEAGISFGSVFTYFPSKEELFGAAVLEPLHKLREMFSLPDEKSGTPLEQIAHMVSRHVRFFSEQVEYLRIVQYVLGQPDRFPALFQQLDQFLSDAVEALCPLIAAGQKAGELAVIDPKLVCLSYIAFLNGTRLTIVDDSSNGIWTMFSTQALRLFGPLDERQFAKVIAENGRA
ncbi:MAG: TetR/AcrR family transcriptional regulator [Clostridia bacterium]